MTFVDARPWTARLSPVFLANAELRPTRAARRWSHQTGRCALCHAPYATIPVGGFGADRRHGPDCAAPAARRAAPCGSGNRGVAGPGRRTRPAISLLTGTNAFAV